MAAAGPGRVSSLARHRHPTNRPHLTLASAGQFPPAAAAAIVGALRELQAQVRSALDGAGRQPQHEPGLWTPHISLRRVPPDQAALAAQAVGEVVAGGALVGHVATTA